LIPDSHSAEYGL